MKNYFYLGFCWLSGKSVYFNVFKEYFAIFKCINTYIFKHSLVHKHLIINNIRIYQVNAKFIQISREIWIF